MSEKHCPSCGSQQEKEKKENNSGTKHSKKVNKKIDINLFNKRAQFSDGQ